MRGMTQFLTKAASIVTVKGPPRVVVVRKHMGHFPWKTARSNAILAMCGFQASCQSQFFGTASGTLIIGNRVGPRRSNFGVVPMTDMRGKYVATFL
mmetsp:Transcript_32879/g.67333  ORF Transcript_32879/g.67333 Transcript_32879/m.67333 type:complete len:96 (-) Transcript_32879:247-534(-)